jgi:hypothetical protein
MEFMDGGFDCDVPPSVGEKDFYVSFLGLLRGTSCLFKNQLQDLSRDSACLLPFKATLGNNHTDVIMKNFVETMGQRHRQANVSLHFELGNWIHVTFLDRSKFAVS